MGCETHIFVDNYIDLSIKYGTVFIEIIMHFWMAAIVLISKTEAYSLTGCLYIKDCLISQSEYYVRLLNSIQTIPNMLLQRS